MNAKKAAAFERRAEIIEILRPKIEEIRDAMNSDPWGFEFDYKAALNSLIKKHGEEKLIMEMWNAKSK